MLDIIFPPAPSGFDPANGFSPYTGLQLLRELREVHGVHLPVVVLTVVIRPELDQELEALDVADIIHKPVRPSELKQRVEAVWNISSGAESFFNLAGNRLRCSNR